MVAKVAKSAETRISSGQTLLQLCRGRVKNTLSSRPVPLVEPPWAVGDKNTATSILTFGLTLIDRNYSVDQAVKRLLVEVPKASHNDLVRWRKVLSEYEATKTVRTTKIR